MSAELPRFQVCGCNHQQTPLAVRERLALTSEAVKQLQGVLLAEPAVEEALVLNTCNRVEVYAVTSAPDWPGRVGAWVQAINGFPVEEFRRYAYHRVDVAAVRHAFEVAAGLNSQIIGETQILGQMKSAYQEAQQRCMLGPRLHRVFQKAFQAAKWARSDTRISTGSIGLGNVAVELACRIFGKLTVSRTLIIGSGEIGRDVAKAFRSRGVACMSLASRTAANAEALARELDGLVIPFNSWQNSLAFTDIGIFATSSAEPILSLAEVELAMQRRHYKPLFLIDLALPRDVEASVGDLPNVFLYNLEDLSAIANENLRNRQADIEHCLAELERRAEYVWERM